MASRSLSPLIAVARFLRPYRWRVAGAACALVFTAGATLMLGRGIQVMIDQGFGDGSSAALQSAITLLLVSGGHNADLDHIASAHGLNLGRCDGRRVRDETGFAIGGVAPIGHKIAVPVYMDEALLDYDVVWAAAGRPDSVFSVDPKALAQATGATVIDVKAAAHELDA